MTIIERVRVPTSANCASEWMVKEAYGDDFTDRETGKAYRVEGLERWQCENCGESVMYPGQIQRNHERIEAVRLALRD